MTKKLTITNVDEELEAEAIKECKKLWGEIEASGLSKAEFFKSPAGKVWHSKGYVYDCPLCSYSHNFKSCKNCPLVKEYGSECNELGYHWWGLCEPSWFKAIREL